MKYFYFCIATFLGVGKLPLAPGTWASVVAALLFYPLIDHPVVQGCVLIAVFFVGVFACTQYAKNLGEVDPSSAVIDEVLGMGVAMLAIPKQWSFAVMALILFRVFDIWKPYPIRRIEKLPGGWGIMTDDLVAGIYAWVW
ncbi:MAG TPA: phosphatidylglycerophosphatase A, partial [bacterium]|nr:phosphatidylglycerophosphatase A [bacterium]